MLCPVIVMYLLLGPPHPPYPTSILRVPGGSYPMTQPSNPNPITCPCPAPHHSLPIQGILSTCISPGSRWSSISRPFTPCPLLLTHPPYAISVYPHVLHPPTCSTVSHRLFADSTMAFDYYPLPRRLFPSHRPPGVGVRPRTTPPLPAGDQCTQPPTFPLLPVGPPPSLMSPRSHWPTAMPAYQIIKYFSH